MVCLLSHGADVHERDGGGNLPIHLAAVSGDINILKVFHKNLPIEIANIKLYELLEFSKIQNSFLTFCILL